MTSVLASLPFSLARSYAISLSVRLSDVGRLRSRSNPEQMRPRSEMVPIAEMREDDDASNPAPAPLGLACSVPVMTIENVSGAHESVISSESLVSFVFNIGMN